MVSVCEHPTPQFAREAWTSLDGPWAFAHDDGGVGLDQGWVTRTEPFDRTITVPFPPESPASGIHDLGFHPVVWYRRAFRVADEHRQGRVLLHFGAVDYAAMVWVNGQLVATHEGGHTPFVADITTALQDDDADQVVVVRAEDSPHNLGQPRGKQDWELEPHRIWYHRTTGIWQSVWLEPVSATYLTRVRWTPDLDRGALGLDARLNRPTNATLRVRLSLRGLILADDTIQVGGDTIRRSIALPADLLQGRADEILWWPDHPNLIDAELTLHVDDQVADRVLSYAGMRSVGVRDGRFVLNGRPYYLRLVLEQGFWPESHLAAPDDDARRREVELTKALGFNGMRIHQKVEDPRFLYWCDRLGVMVWGEMANAYTFSPDAVARFTREWIEAVERDVSHPCVVAWVPLNESWGVPNLIGDPAQRAYCRALADLTRALDPTRPVISNDGWEHQTSDIIGVHDYSAVGDELRARYGTAGAVAHTFHQAEPANRVLVLGNGNNPEAPLMLTEVGGIGYPPVSGERWHFREVDTPERLREKYDEIIGAILDCETVAGFCYTQLTDTLQEKNGLLTAEREPKLDIDQLREITTRPARFIRGS